MTTPAAKDLPEMDMPEVMEFRVRPRNNPNRPYIVRETKGGKIEVRRETK
jgi:hypothetical protein